MNLYSGFSNYQSAILFLTSYLISVIFILIFYKNELDTHKFNNRKNTILSWVIKFFIVLPFVYLCANRSVTTGYDTSNYIAIQYRIHDHTYHSTSGSFDILYLLLCKLSWYVSNGKSWGMLFLLASLTLLSIFYSIEEISTRKTELILGILLFYLYLSPIMMDQSRQLLAIGFSSIAFSKIVQKERLKSIFWIIIAMLFHESAVTMFFFVFMRRTILRKKTIYWIFALFSVASSLLMRYLSNIIYFFLPARYEYILIQSHSGFYGNGWIVDIFPMFLTMIIYYRTIKYEKKTLDTTALQACAWSALPMRIAGYYSFFIMRLSYYGEATCILLAVISLKNASNRDKTRKYFAIYLLSYFLHWWVDFVILGLNGAIPYQFYIQ